LGRGIPARGLHQCFNESLCAVEVTRKGQRQCCGWQIGSGSGHGFTRGSVLMGSRHEWASGKYAGTGNAFPADPSPIRRWLNDERPLVSGIEHPPDEARCLETLHEPRYLATISTNDYRQPHRSNPAGFDAPKKNTSLLQRHSPPRENSVQRRLYSNTGLKKPGQQKILTPFTSCQLLERTAARNRE
jgi:hypothetical protein